jgi:hypothetical protein
VRVTKNDIKMAFFGSESWNEVRTKFKELGLLRVVHLRGYNKYVFKKRGFKWVVKIQFGWDNKPNKDTKIAKYFLWPEEAGGKEMTRHGSKQTLTLSFQRKVKVTGEEELLTEFKEQLKRNGARWTGDNHANNIGVLNGRIWIIDY